MPDDLLVLQQERMLDAVVRSIVREWVNLLCSSAKQALHMCMLTWVF